MAIDKNFRSAINGFNRADVVNYMEECAINQEKSLRQLRDENTKLRSDLDKLEDETQTLRAALADAEAVRVPADAPPAPPAEAPVYISPREPGELELAAYRRAEAMERSARLQARRLCRQVNEIIENATDHMSRSQIDVQTLMQDLSINLRSLTDTFAALKLEFEGTVGALEAIEPLDTSDYNA